MEFTLKGKRCSQHYFISLEDNIEIHCTRFAYIAVLRERKKIKEQSNDGLSKGMRALPAEGCWTHLSSQRRNSYWCGLFTDRLFWNVLNFCLWADLPVLKQLILRHDVKFACTVPARKIQWRAYFSRAEVIWTPILDTLLEMKERLMYFFGGRWFFTYWWLNICISLNMKSLEWFLLEVPAIHPAKVLLKCSYKCFSTWMFNMGSKADL